MIRYRKKGAVLIRSGFNLVEFKVNTGEKQADV